MTINDSMIRCTGDVTMRRTRWRFGVAAVLAYVVLTGLVVATAWDAYSLVERVVMLPAGASFVGSGLALWAQRPHNRTGALLVIVGLTFLGEQLRWGTESTPLVSIGTWVSPLYLAFFTWALLAFPGGRLDTTLARGIVMATFVDLTIVYHATQVFGSSELAVEAARWALAVAAFLFSAASLLLIHRWSLGSTPWRRAVAPVLWPGVATLMALAYYDVTGFLTEPGTASIWIFRVTFVLIPFAFLAVLLRGRLARASIAELVVDLGKAHTPDERRDAIARTLGDPSVTIAYWLRDENRYVDLAGHDVDLPNSDDRAATQVVRQGRRVAAISHDRALSEEPELLSAVAAAAAMALENEQLHADLRARLEDLKSSRARIVEAADTERKRIERDLHDGTQQRLTSAIMSLGMAEATLTAEQLVAKSWLAQTRNTLAIALDELRDLSQGIHPSVLTSSGLRPALEDLVYVTPLPVTLIIRPDDLDRRLPVAIEQGAYFVVAEALTNVTKHAAASGVIVTLCRQESRVSVSIRDDGNGCADPDKGTGLRGLADRIHALGGTFSINTDPNAGTEVRAEIPCA